MKNFKKTDLNLDEYDLMKKKKRPLQVTIILHPEIGKTGVRSTGSTSS